MSRITKKITYNIKDRGRKHTGQDRSNVNVRSMADSINSPAVQEMVTSGGLFGFYGHEVRMLHGMHPPDTVFAEDGREIRIAPAVRTVELSADNHGNVSHRQEFLENEAGEYAYQQYKAKIGGFSTAASFKPMPDGSRSVIGFYGFDYVRNPNYKTNTSHGQFDGMGFDVAFDCAMFDGINDERLDPTKLQLKHALEQNMINQYDSISQAIQNQGLVDYYQQEALLAQQAMDNLISRQNRREKLKIDKNLAMVDSLICQSRPFDDYLSEIKSFDSISLDMDILKTTDEVKEKQADIQKINAQIKEKGQGLFNRFWGNSW